VNGSIRHRPRHRPIPNLFYVCLVLVSTLFVITALAYLMGPYVVQKAAANPAEGSLAVAFSHWMERRGPAILAAEFVLMLLAGTLAMLLDPWFTRLRNQADRQPRA
jgi:predicted PurR-regulated permease PerM